MLKTSTVHAFSDAVARQFKEERLHQKLTMSAVAERAGISQHMLGYIERGLRKPSLEMAFRISVALEIDLAKVVALAAKNPQL